MDYKGYQRNPTDYRSSTRQPKATPIDGVTSTKPPFGQFAPTVECRFPSPPPWNMILPPYPTVTPPSVFPRTSGSTFPIPPSGCGNWPANSLYEARHNFNTPSQFVNSAGAQSSNTKECHSNSASSLIQRNVFGQQRGSALAKEPRIQNSQGSSNVSGHHTININSDGFQAPHNVFPQQFTSPPPPSLPHQPQSYLAADISSQRFTVPPPSLSYIPRFDLSSHQHSCFPKSHGSSQPQIPIQPTPCVRFQPQVPHHSQLSSFNSSDDNCQLIGSNEFGAGIREFCEPSMSQEFKRNAVNLQEGQVDSGTSRIQSSSHHVQEKNEAVSNYANWNAGANLNADIQTPDQRSSLKSDNLEYKNDVLWIVNWTKRKESAAKSQCSRNRKHLSVSVILILKLTFLLFY